jgi:Na+-translocating ferredoxin:NAD+ oxidoreductase RnfG subunit
METILIVITPQGRVGAVEVLAFNEPEDYLPPPRWLDRFDGKALAKDLKPGLAVPNLSGATLTARAVRQRCGARLPLHAFLTAPAGR